MAKNTIIFACLEEVSKKELERTEKELKKLEENLKDLVERVTSVPPKT